MNRREFLGLSSAAALAALYPGANATALAGLARSAEGMLVVADHRYSDSLIFARALGIRGAGIFSMKAGLAEVWFDALAPRLAAGGRKLVGLTLESELFVLERLAESCGMRSCYVGRHDWRARSGSQHVLRGSIGIDQVAQALAGGAELWAATTADGLMTATADPSWQERKVSVDLARAADSPRFLVSWMMTPSDRDIDARAARVTCR
jgi:hypothetical protein